MTIDNLFELKYVLVFVSLILPGFVMMKVFRLKMPSKNFLLKDILFEALAYSLLNNVIFGIIPYLLLINEYEALLYISFFVQFTIFPVVLSLFFIWI